MRLPPPTHWRTDLLLASTGGLPPVGSSAYGGVMMMPRIVKRIDKQEIVVERRDEWFEQNGKEIRRKPFFKQIRFRVLDDPNNEVAKALSPALALASSERSGDDDREIHDDHEAQWFEVPAGEQFE